MNFNQGYYVLFFLLFTFPLPIISKKIPRKTLSLGSNEQKIIPISLHPFPPAAYALISIGDPPIKEELHIDTGVDLTWVLHEKPSDYDPSRSSSFSNISCDGLVNVRSVFPSRETGQCNYAVKLADKSSYRGILGRETFIFETGEGGLGMSKNVLFGFGITVGGPQAGTGTLGLKLGRGLSILNSFNWKFSICIGNFYDNLHEKHFISLGDNAIFTGMEISLDTREGTYKINLASITINRKNLGIDNDLSKSNTLLDTGTSSLRLVKGVYSVVFTEIVKEMTKAGYDMLSIDGDTCYSGKISKHIPLLVVLTFDKVKINMEAPSLFMQDDENYFCLNVHESPINENLIGIPVFADYNLGFDIPNQKLHLKDIKCSKLYDNIKDELGHRDP